MPFWHPKVPLGWPKVTLRCPAVTLKCRAYALDFYLICFRIVTHMPYDPISYAFLRHFRCARCVKCIAFCKGSSNYHAIQYFPPRPTVNKSCPPVNTALPQKTYKCGFVGRIDIFDTRVKHLYPRRGERRKKRKNRAENLVILLMTIFLTSGKWSDFGVVLNVGDQSANTVSSRVRPQN